MCFLNSIRSNVTVDFLKSDKYYSYLFCFDQSKIKISNSTGFGTNHSAFFHASNCPEIRVSDSLFFGFEGVPGTIFFNENSTLYVTSTQFYENSNDNYGAAIFSRDSNVTLKGNLFRNNSAVRGAGIYFEDDAEILLTLIIENNSFISNNADIAGGGFFTFYNIPLLENNTFINNSAGYGNDFASAPFFLLMEDNLNFENLKLNYIPNSEFPFPLKFHLKDFYNNSIKAENVILTAKINFADSNIYNILHIFDLSYGKKKILGKISADYEFEYFAFENLTLVFQPLSTAIMSVAIEGIHRFAAKIFNYSFPHYFDSMDRYNYIFSMISTECPIGILNNFFIFLCFFK